VSADPAQLPAELAGLLDKTLGKKAIPGILADWIDDHSSHWTAFAEALRISEPFETIKDTNLSYFGSFRYRMVTDGVAFTLTEHLGTGWPAKRPGMILGVYRFTKGEEAQWMRFVPQKVMEGGLGDRLKNEIGEPEKPKKAVAKKPPKKAVAKKPPKKAVAKKPPKKAVAKKKTPARKSSPKK
jgi:hypothetical protein